MLNYYTYPDSIAAGPSRTQRIAIVTQGVKLGDETRGYTRFRFLSELLSQEGFEVDLITSTFQHWNKAQRDTTLECYQNLPYRICFIYEPGYKRNLDPARIRSHRIFAKNLRRFFNARFSEKPTAYDLIYSEIPPNDMARTCAEVAQAQNIPYIADVNDLWPEAMRMALDVPVLSDVAFKPFELDAKRTYNLMTAAVGTSDEYADRPAQDRSKPYPKRTVYVGNRLDEFDEGAKAHADEIEKPEGEFWVTYAGTLGASYDIRTLIEAATIAASGDARAIGNTAAATRNATAAGDASATAKEAATESTAAESKQIRVKLLGDGPDRADLEKMARDMDAPVDFIGYAPYDLMAAYLCASDVTVNSLVKTAAQSIVTKIGDYLAAGIPMINTGSSPEFRAKVEADGFGVNVEAEDPTALAYAILQLANDSQLRKAMGSTARRIAETQFDQKHSYHEIVKLIREVL